MAISFSDDVYHLFTYRGCDSTSAFYGKGKSKPWKILENFPDFMAVFSSIGSTYSVSEEEFAMVEKFTWHIYGQTNVDKVDTARYCIFRLGQFGEDTMPCTQNVLRQHLNCTSYQACIWKRALQQVIAAPNINECGWSVVDDHIEIVWMTIPPAPEGILENVNCGCQSGCTTRRCVCKRAALKCTSLCRCYNCTNQKESESDAEEEYQEAEESLVDDDVNIDDIDYGLYL